MIGLGGTFLLFLLVARMSRKRQQHAKDSDPDTSESQP